MDINFHLTKVKFVGLLILGLSLLISYLLFLSTLTYSKFPLPDPDIKLEKNKTLLSIENAKMRSKLLSNVSSSLFLYLSTQDYFRGEIIILFSIIELSDNFFLDFDGDSISTIKINGEKITKNLSWPPGRLYISKNYQRLGLNQISIKYLCNYSIDDEGIHKYYDFKLNQTYL